MSLATVCYWESHFVCVVENLRCGNASHYCIKILHRYGLGSFYESICFTPLKASVWPHWDRSLDEWRKYSFNVEWYLFLQYFTANRDRSSIVTHPFNPPLLARFIRIHPRGWSSRICMRVELYGCRAGKGYFSSNEDFIQWSSQLTDLVVKHWNDMREVAGLNSVGPGT